MIKLPKKYITNGVKFRIKQVPGYDGNFDSVSQIIEIGRDISGDADRAWAWLHETFESSAAVKGRRYASGHEDRDYVFVMTHKELDNVLREVAIGVLKLLKANGYKEGKE